jgi:quercetin dioxygenase-like cupin family protein
LVNFAFHNKKMSDNTGGEIEKLKKHAIVELLDYLPNAVVSKTIIKKTTGDITLFSIAEGEQVPEKLLPFDTYIQVIDGTATFLINKRKFLVNRGEGMIIPAHIKHAVTAGSQFKMISTIIKSGYE